jgi:hypothetical protein
MSRKIIAYPDIAKGAFCQGDIIIWRLPIGIEVDRSQKIAERDGRIILSEGETIGHFHAIELASRTGTAALYIDSAVTRELERRSILTRTNQCIGYLVVEGGPVVLSHPEHDGARLPAGSYYVGFQSESVAGEMRRVQD